MDLLGGWPVVGGLPTLGRTEERRRGADHGDPNEGLWNGALETVPIWNGALETVPIGARLKQMWR